MLIITDFIGIFRSGAGEGNRTLVSGLGSPHSTIGPHPQPLLVLNFVSQVSSRLIASRKLFSIKIRRAGDSIFPPSSSRT